MKAVVIRKPGGPEVLELSEAPTPVPGPGHVRVRVEAAAVNRADLLQRRGLYPPPPGWPTDVPGLEYAGTVETTGTGVTRWRSGDRVMGLVGGGAYAEAVVVHEDEALPLPDGLSAVDGAAVPEVFITAHDAVLTQMRLRAAEWILIHGVGSGVGTAAVQIAGAVGARSLGTSRSQWKLERAAADGLEVGIHVGVVDFVEAVREATDGHGADGILDLVGGPYLGGNLRTLAERGRIIIVGLVAGAAHELDMRTLMRKRGMIRGTTLRNRSLPEKIAATHAFGEFALPLLKTGRLHPVIHAVLPMADAGAAHRMLEADENYGKVVLRW